MAFIDLTNVDIVDEVSEDAKVLVEENGEIKRTAMPSGGGSGVCIIEFTENGYKPSYEEIEKTFFEGKNIFLKRGSGSLSPMNTYYLDNLGLQQIASTDGCTFFRNGSYYDD